MYLQANFTVSWPKMRHEIGVFGVQFSGQLAITKLPNLLQTI